MIETCANFLYWLIKIVLIAAYRILRDILLGITLLFDWLFSKNYRYICPTEGCGFVGKTSVYQCPHCKKLLTDLKPSRSGFLFTHCPHCNKRVALSSLTGRNKYTKVCPKCHKAWDSAELGKRPASVYVVEGASKSGKTSFLIQMLMQWRSFNHVRFAIDLYGYAITQADVFKYILQESNQLSTYIMHVKKLFRSRLAYFYDANETSSSSLQAGMTESYFNLANGIFLIIDPWAEKCILNAFGEKSSDLPQIYQYSTQDATAVIGRLCSKLEHASAISSNSRFNIPICIVVTKCDVNGLDKKIGVKKGYSKSINEWKEHSRLVENFLTDNGMYNFVNVVKTRFKKYAFFAVGIREDSCWELSDSVLNPVLWMMYNAK